MKTKTCLAGMLLAAALADAETVTRQHLVLASNAPVVLTATATNDLNSALQRGLFEEEGNRDLNAAISAYQSLVGQFDQSRQVAATAIFRLGECYRKQGKTNEAVAQYERIVREFSDQPTLTTLSRQNITGLGIRPSGASSTKNADEELLGKLKKLTDYDLEQVLPMLVPDNILTTLMQDRNIARQDRIKLERVRADNHPDIQNQDAQIKALDLRISERVNTIMLALQIRAGVSPASESTTTPTGASDDEGKEIRRIQKMIQDSPDLINATGEGGMTPISQAAGAGWLRVVGFLLDHGAALDSSALFQATQWGNKAMVEFLIARGADINATDGTGGTALHSAAEKGYLSVAETLIQHGANLEWRNARINQGQTPLHRAAIYGRTAVVALLVAKGADLNARDASGVTALGRAVLSGQSGVMDTLLKAGANPDSVDDGGRTALSYAAEGGNVILVKALLAAKANPNAGKNGSALFATANPEILKLLLAAGANPNSQDQTGRTPLLAVIEKGPVESAALLIQHGADVNTANDNNHMTPLQMAVWVQDLAKISLLLTNQADVNAQHPSGRTALDMSREAEGGYHPFKPGDYGGSSSPPDQPLARKISALLREYGALDNLPKRDRIELRRAAGSYAEVFLKDTNNWNRFSLFEVLATVYRMTANVGERPSLASIAGQGKWLFPDLAQVKIRRATPDGKAWKEILVDVEAISKTGDCGRDVPLEWGDVLEIPEKDHLVTDAPQELPQVTRELLARCLKRTVTVRVGAECKAVELSPNPSWSGYPSQFSVRSALEISGLLRASSDTSRVKVIRLDSKSGKTSERVVDSNNPSNFFPANGDPNTKLWLRDGDVIEVPEKP